MNLQELKAQAYDILAEKEHFMRCVSDAQKRLEEKNVLIDKAYSASTVPQLPEGLKELSEKQSQPK